CTPCTPRSARRPETPSGSCAYNHGMDDWYARLARDLISETPARHTVDSAASIEIAFGHARAAVAYALELGRAHRLPAPGVIAGDSVWWRFGEGRGGVVLNRREGYVVLDVRVPGAGGAPMTSSERRIRWDSAGHALLDEAGEAFDLGAATRASI